MRNRMFCCDARSHSKVVIGVLLVAIVWIGKASVHAETHLGRALCGYDDRYQITSPCVGVTNHRSDGSNVPAWSQPADWFEAQESSLLSPAVAVRSTQQEPLCGCGDAPCTTPVIPFGGMFGGFEFLWMRANFDQNVAMIIDPPIGNTLVPFDYSLELTPRTWLGWQSPRGGGFRATYWRFDNQADCETATAVAGATPVFLFVYGAGGNLSRNAYADLGETLQSRHRLNLQALDLEFTERFERSSLRGMVGVGLRLARMDQHLRGDVFDAGGALEEAVTNDLNFEGVGPTVSLQANRGIGTTRLAMQGGLRGSLLMSDTRQTIYEMKNAGVDELEDIAEQREVLTAMEMSIGLQWNRSMGPQSRCFIRAGYECQAWFDVGGPVDSHSTISLDAISLAAGLHY